MEGQHGRDAHRQQAAEHIAGIFGNLRAAPEYHEVQEQQAYNANKAQFLTDHVKDKVRVVLRQKVQLTLRAFEKAFTKEALAVWTGDIDYAEFIEKYGFDWFAVSSGSHMDDYLYGEPDYEQVFENEDDGIVIYRRIKEQTNP